MKLWHPNHTNIYNQVFYGYRLKQDYFQTIPPWPLDASSNTSWHPLVGRSIYLDICLGLAGCIWVLGDRFLPTKTLQPQLTRWGFLCLSRLMVSFWRQTWFKYASHRAYLPFNYNIYWNAFWEFSNIYLAFIIEDDLPPFHIAKTSLFPTNVLSLETNTFLCYALTLLNSEYTSEVPSNRKIMSGDILLMRLLNASQTYYLMFL